MAPKLFNALSLWRSRTLPIPHAPHSTLLGCNDPPTTSEQWESIQVSIDKAADILKALEDKDDSSRSLKRKRSLREDTLSFIQTHQTLLSPIRRIPAEIWSEIFYEYTISERDSALNRHPQFVLAKVCRKWRDITYGTASLWSCPPPINLSAHGSRAQRDWVRYKSYIDHAPGQALTLNFKSNRNNRYQDTQRLGQLLPLAEQWVDVTAKLTCQVFDPCSVLLRGKLRNLQKLDLTVVGPVLRELPNDLFAVSQNLTDVVLWTIRINYWPILPPHVARFEGACDGYKNFYTMFQHAASSLEECSLIWSFAHVRPASPIPTSHLTFPNLRHLSIRGFLSLLDDTFDEFLPNVTLPNLTVFHIWFCLQEDRMLALADLFKRSTLDPLRGHCLHTLSIRGDWWWAAPGHFTTIFTQVPNLVELHVDWLDAETWEQLTRTTNNESQEPPLLPRLSRVFIYKCSQWIGTTIKSFLRARTIELAKEQAGATTRCTKLEYVVLAFKNETKCQRTWESLDSSVAVRKRDMMKLRSLSVPLFSSFEAARLTGKDKQLRKIMEVVEADPRAYDIRSVMDSRLPSVLNYIVDSKHFPTIQKRAQDILDSWQPQLQAYARDYHWHRYPVTEQERARTKLKLALVYHYGPQQESPSNPFGFESKAFSEPLIARFGGKEFEYIFKW